MYEENLGQLIYIVYISHYYKRLYKRHPLVK